ncbi:MAG TPA: precorrin-3B C(17)-methyltransferase [Mycobacteriales bacterium]|nr:precorrin-3B C(17)-methyltransferase [Mycobacteriales bacterium]
MIGLVTTTAAGRRAATEISCLGETKRYDVRELSRAWAECEALVLFLATGAAVRLLAPLLSDKRTDPGVVCVDEGRRFAVALVGGHAGGANDLAQQVADLLGCEPVVTTGTDAMGLPGLDTWSWPAEGDVARVSRALLDGEAVRLEMDPVHPIPPLPVGTEGELVLAVTDRVVDADVVLRPPSLVLGIGASKGVKVEELEELVVTTLAAHRLSTMSVSHVATVDAKADEGGIVGLCAKTGWPLVTHPASLLAATPVPNPSPHPLEAVGTPSVAEAAALQHGDLVVEKTKSPMATLAVSRIRPRGRLSVVGLGPGARDLLTPRAVEALRSSSVWVGLDQYVDQVRDLARPGTRLVETGLGKEEERAHSAVALAAEGHAVALLGSGDAQVYAMASPALEVAGEDIDVEVVPGVTAALAAGALLGAPLGHDHASISLSDLHTPWEAIEQRVRAAAEGDLVVSFYNPRSRGRDWQLPKALAILSDHRPPTTPVGVVTHASREGQQVVLSTLAELDVETVGMYSLVTVGSSQSTVVAGRFVTPRGYRWMP